MLVYLYVQDLGDGSTGIDFVAEEDHDEFVGLYENDDFYRDGDGFGPKAELTFADRDDAESCGIKFWAGEEVL